MSVNEWEIEQKQNWNFAKRKETQRKETQKSQLLNLGRSYDVVQFTHTLEHRHWLQRSCSMFMYQWIVFHMKLCAGALYALICLWICVPNCVSVWVCLCVYELKFRHLIIVKTNFHCMRRVREILRWWIVAACSCVLNWIDCVGQWLNQFWICQIKECNGRVSVTLLHRH